MATISEDIRCENDLALFESLSRDPEVCKVNERIARMEQESPLRTRRRLLATSVRLSQRMSPNLHAMMNESIQKLGVEIPCELFVFPGPQHNAMCFRPEAGRLFIMFSSSLLEDFHDNETRFVIGHELGHYLYRHHDIPIGYLLRGKSKVGPRLALQLFAWSRYAEISADRAGAFCAENNEDVCRALFKIASGLTGRTIHFQVDDFLLQVDQMQMEDAEPGTGSPPADWFSTHPFSPLRVKALQLFHASELVTAGGESRENLELGVQKLMSLMEPSYLEGRTEATESMRRLLFAAAITVARADGEISEEEVRIFEKFFGEGAYSETLDQEGLAADLERRARRVRETCSVPQVMQLVRDLCLVARADGYVSVEACQILERIAEVLGVSTFFVSEMLDAELELD